MGVHNTHTHNTEGFDIELAEDTSVRDGGSLDPWLNHLCKNKAHHPGALTFSHPAKQKMNFCTQVKCACQFSLSNNVMAWLCLFRFPYCSEEETELRNCPTSMLVNFSVDPGYQAGKEKKATPAFRKLTV